MPSGAASAEPTEDPAAETDRQFVLVGVGGVSPDAIAAALGIGEWSAGQIVRRGGEHLVGTFTERDAAQLEERLADLGLAVYSVPAREVRREPLRATGGGFETASLELETSSGRHTIPAASLLLIVEGPITRSAQADSVRRKIHTLHPEDGHRFHLHLREPCPPFEIDPSNFELRSAAVTGSTLLDIRHGLDRLAGAVPRDSAFRLQVPALAPPEASEPLGRKTALGAVRSLLGDAPGKERERRLILDNVAQFRLYSALRCAVERRR